MNYFNRHRADRSAFTLIEVLATMLLMAIVLPVTMRGVSLSVAAAGTARHLAEASMLGEAKLNEWVVTGDFATAGSLGDFGDDWPAYAWTIQTTSREYGLTEVTLTVSWQERGQVKTLVLTTLASDIATSTGT